MCVKWAPVVPGSYLDLLRVPSLASRARDGDLDAQGELQEIALWYLHTQILPALARASGCARADLRKAERLARSSAEAEIRHLLATQSVKDFKRWVYQWGVELWAKVAPSGSPISPEDFKRFEAAEREYYALIYKLAKLPFSFCSRTIKRVRALTNYVIPLNSK